MPIQKIYKTTKDYKSNNHLRLTGTSCSTSGVNMLRYPCIPHPSHPYLYLSSPRISTPPYGFGLSLHRQRSEALQLSAWAKRIVQHATDQQLPRPGRWSDEAQGQLGRLHAGCVDTHAVSTSVGHPDAVVLFIRDPEVVESGGKNWRKRSKSMIDHDHEISWVHPTLVHHATWNSASTNRTPNNI